MPNHLHPEKHTQNRRWHCGVRPYGNGGVQSSINEISVAVVSQLTDQPIENLLRLPKKVGFSEDMALGIAIQQRT